MIPWKSHTNAYKVLSTGAATSTNQKSSSVCTAVLLDLLKFDIQLLALCNIEIKWPKYWLS